MAIKTAKQLVAACLNVVNNYKTIYVLSCFGAPMNAKNKTRYAKADPYRAAAIQAASADTFGFDCVCFIKGLFWGWSGNPNEVYGGASYKANGVPDIGADQMIKVCTDVSADFSTIMPGELVWQPGHVGIYVGDGMAAEATYEPVSGVQLQCVLPMGVKPGMPATGWVKHGKLPWVSYEENQASFPDDGSRYRLTVENLTMDATVTLSAKLKELGYLCSVEEQEETAPAPAPQPEVKEEWNPQEGDIVQFKGGMQYGNANATSGAERPAGLAKITKFVPGKLHPYHLVKTGNTGPYGWVDRNTFKKE